MSKVKKHHKKKVKVEREAQEKPEKMLCVSETT